MRKRTQFLMSRKGFPAHNSGREPTKHFIDADCMVSESLETVPMIPRTTDIV